jgi:hypothetical protein
VKKFLFKKAAQNVANFWVTYSPDKNFLGPSKSSPNGEMSPNMVTLLGANTVASFVSSNAESTVL